MTFPKSLDNASLPPVLLEYDYTITAKSLVDGTRRRISSGSRRPKRSDRFVEYMDIGLRPGRHEIRVEAKVKLGDHPLRQFWNIYDWASFLKDMLNPLGYAAEEIAAYLTKTGLSKKAALWVLEEVARDSEVGYIIDVPVKAPDVRGMKPSQAVHKLRN